jgi:hypothetical protein
MKCSKSLYAELVITVYDLKVRFMRNYLIVSDTGVWGVE